MEKLTIGLVAAPFIDFDHDHQVEVIRDYLDKNQSCDWLCFGESYIQGFEGLTWDYKKDLDQAFSVHSDRMRGLMALARSYETALSFGFIERDGDKLYSSQITIDHKGDLLHLFRRVSPGWKEPIATSQYKEGPGLTTFDYKGRRFGVAVCGDLFDEEVVDQLAEMPMDYLLWPLYIDYSQEDWEGGVCVEYAQQAAKVGRPVLMVNSYSQDVTRARGGAYLFKDGSVTSCLPLGNSGVLTIDL